MDTPLFDLSVSEFSVVRQQGQQEAEFLFSHSWQCANQAEFDNLRKYFDEAGVYAHATSIVFEDLTGHVTTAESCNFVIHESGSFAPHRITG